MQCIRIAVQVVRIAVHTAVRVAVKIWRRMAAHVAVNMIARRIAVHI